MFVNNPFPDQVVVFCAGGAPDDPLQPAVLSRVNGAPCLSHILATFKRSDVTDIIIVTREGGPAIERLHGDGSAHGLTLRYFHDPEDHYGSGGALRAVENLLRPAFFTVIGTRYLVVDYESLGAAFVESGLPCLMTVWENTDTYHPSNCLVGVDDRGRQIVTRFHPEHRAGMKHVNYGATIFRDDVVDRLPPEYSELEGFHQGDALRRRIGAFQVGTRYWDTTSPTGLRDLRNGLLSGAIPGYIHQL